MADNYLSIWRHFNKFIIRLDKKSQWWEDRVALFCGYLISKGLPSSTIKSYISAIKSVLRDDGYTWDQNRSILFSLIQACKLKNDVIKCRLPIQRNLLNLILFEVMRVLPNQCYLVVLYRALFALAYYGMMHIGELTQAPGCHAVKAKNVHVGQNKDKIKLVLFTSKTHGRGSYPQYIKIRALPQYFLPSAKRARFFYPFDLVDRFIQLC